jgi:hypothetical protein
MMNNFKKIPSLSEALKIKSSLLSQGVAVKSLHTDYKPSSPSLYSYERTEKPKDLIIPQEIIIYQNPDQKLRVFATVRYNAQSPWTLSSEDGAIFLSAGAEKYEVSLPEIPAFYGERDNKEKSTKYFQKLGGDTIALVMLNYCEYYARNLQCRFCEIHENFSTTNDAYLRVKDPEKMASHLAHAIHEDPSIRQVIFNSGNYSRDNNRTYREFIKTLQFLMQRLSPEEIQRVAMLVIVAPPEDFSLVKQLKEAGATSIYVNLEIWDEDVGQEVIPGKMLVGKDTYFHCFDTSLAHFGKGYVYTNLIFGIQGVDMHSPVKTFNAEKEWDTMSLALDELTRREVLLTNTIYHSSGKNVIGHIHIPEDDILKFHLHYGEKIFDSGLVSTLCDAKHAVYASMEGIPNSLNNEAYTLAKHTAKREFI